MNWVNTMYSSYYDGSIAFFQDLGACLTERRTGSSGIGREESGPLNNEKRHGVSRYLGPFQRSGCIFSANRWPPERRLACSLQTPST